MPTKTRKGRYSMRELLRSIARHNMKREGIQHMNKKRYTAKGEKKQSIFGQYWREFAAMPALPKKGRKRIRSAPINKRAAAQNKRIRTAEG